MMSITHEIHVNIIRPNRSDQTIILRLEPKLNTFTLWIDQTECF